MKKIVIGLGAVFVALVAIAQTVTTVPVTVTTTPTSVTVSMPTTIIPIPATAPVCQPAPAPSSKTIACPSGTTGSWVQTTTYTSAVYPTCWTPVLSPLGAPAGACTTTSPPPISGLPAVGSLNSIGQPNDIYANGKNLWTTNFNYGGVTETDSVKAPDGNVAIKVTAQTGGSPPGGGGMLPVMGHSPDGPGNFNTTGLNFITYVFWPTRTGQTWQGNFAIPGVTDTLAPGVSLPQIEKFCTPLILNQWNICKVPFASIGLKSGTVLVKIGIQDQMPYGADPQNAAGNVYYIYRVFFSAT